MNLSHRLCVICIMVPAMIMACGYTKQLTTEGRKIRVLTEEQRDRNCEIIDIVIGAHYGYGRDVGDDMRSAMNEAKNMAAAMGGNAIRIISTESESMTRYYSGSSTVTAEALRCNF